MRRGHARSGGVGDSRQERSVVVEADPDLGRLFAEWVERCDVSCRVTRVTTERQARHVATADLVVCSRPCRRRWTTGASGRWPEAAWSW
jgi:hypothetical protein